MVQSLTVVGGNFTSTTIGLVTTPSTGLSSTFNSSLQSLLNGASAAATVAGANFQNINVAGLSGGVSPTVASGAANQGLLDISNTNADGSTVAGSSNVSLAVPTGYNALFVQAPGAETVAGNGASNFLAVFGDNSSVNFNSNGGSGTVAASGPGDFVVVSGSSWSVVGSAGGGDNIISNATNLYVSLAGAGNNPAVPSNGIGSYSQNSNILSGGTNDFIVTGAGVNAITVTGFANVQNLGASDTVWATGSGSFSGGYSGGTLNFINLSTGASSIISGLDVTTGMLTTAGSVTVNASVGGGVYDGGRTGSNSLVGGSGVVTLFAAGSGNYLQTSGNATGSSYNLLNAFSGSGDTLFAAAGSTNNVFFAGTGTESLVSFGSGAQSFFVGTLGSETITGSTVNGSTNAFIFNQSSLQGGGTDVITNFSTVNGIGYINPNNGVSGVTILSFENLAGVHPGTQIDLSNGTTIKLFGVSTSSLNSSIIGGTVF